MNIINMNSFQSVKDVDRINLKKKPIETSSEADVVTHVQLKGLSHEIEMNYKWYKATEPY
jgi:hypothetical protein